MATTITTKKRYLALGTLALMVLFFVVKGLTMQEKPFNIDELRKAVEQALDTNVFEPSNCPKVFSGPSANTVRCFMTHLEYHAAMEGVAIAMKTLVTEPKQMWTGLSGDWKTDYIYRSNEKFKIGFYVAQIIEPPKNWGPKRFDSLPPNWEEFSTFVYFDVFNDQQ